MKRFYRILLDIVIIVAIIFIIGHILDLLNIDIPPFYYLGPEIKLFGVILFIIFFKYAKDNKKWLLINLGGLSIISVILNYTRDNFKALMNITFQVYLEGILILVSIISLAILYFKYYRKN